MTPQMQNTLARLTATHGYTPTFVQDLGYGIHVYSIGGYYYKLRGDGTIL
jgi:hypothetical protein